MEFTASAVRKWLKNLGAGTLCIEPGSPRENGYCDNAHRQGAYRAGRAGLLMLVDRRGNQQ